MVLFFYLNDYILFIRFLVSYFINNFEIKLDLKKHFVNFLNFTFEKNFCLIFFVKSINYLKCLYFNLFKYFNY